MSDPAPDNLPTFSVVIETANLASGDLDQLDRALASLYRQTLPLERANEVVVVDTGTLPVEGVQRLCSKYGTIRVHRASANADYFETKNAALPFVTGDVVVFADSDCEYESSWLWHLVEPFKTPEVDVVAGETWHRIRNFYEFGVALAWVFQPFSGDDHLTAVPNYHANNVAFRRELIQKMPFRPSGHTMRGGQSRHVYKLHQMGLVIWSQPKSRAFHPIGVPGLVIQKTLAAGRDVAIITVKGINPLGSTGLWQKRLRRFWHKLCLMLRQDWRFSFSLPLALPVTAALVLLYLAGYFGTKLDHARRGQTLGEIPL